MKNDTPCEKIGRNEQDISPILWWYSFDKSIGKPWEEGVLLAKLEAAIEIDHDLHRREDEIQIEWDFAAEKKRMRAIIETAKKGLITEEGVRDQFEEIMQPIKEAYDKADGPDLAAY